MVGDRAYVRWVAKMQRHFVGPSAAIAFEQQAYDTDVTDVLRLVRVPTLVVAREWDNPEEDDYVAGLVPGAQLVRLAGRDWTAWVGDQDALIDSIHGFLDAPAPAATHDSILATVLFTDIVGSTEQQARLGDRGWKHLVEQHHLTVRAALSAWRGVENDTAGDGFYTTFDGPARAICCVQQIRDHVRDLGIEIRAGVHTGECELIDGKHGGIAVTTGARISALATSSQILVSQTVKDLVAGSGFTFEPAGEHNLRGVPDRWRLYAVT